MQHGCRYRKQRDVAVAGRAAAAAALVAVTLAAAVAAPAPAAAGPVYALSTNRITLGFVGVSGFAPDASSSVNEAEYRGFGKDLRDDAVDAPQAKSGPGPFPGENSGPQGRVGAYARGDSFITPQIDGSDIPGYNIAEAYRTTPGTAAAVGHFELSGTLTQAGDDGIGIRLDARPYLEVETHHTGDEALAALSFSIALFSPEDELLLFWSPCGDVEACFSLTEGAVSDVLDPLSLNVALSCTGACQDSHGSQASGGLYRLNYRHADLTTFQVRVFGHEAVLVKIPEPALLPPLAAGMLGLLVLARRRRAPL